MREVRVLLQKPVCRSHLTYSFRLSVSGAESEKKRGKKMVCSGFSKGCLYGQGSSIFTQGKSRKSKNWTRCERTFIIIWLEPAR